MRRTTLLLIVLSMSLAIAPAAWASDDEKSLEQLALELIEVTGGANMAKQMMDGLTMQLKPAFPTVPDAYWEGLTDESVVDDLVTLMVPIYVKHYTPEDLAALVEFYRTPLGRRLIESMPVVMEESMAVGAAWGQRRAQEIIEGLKAEGHQPRQI